jgi:hypothetical protein
MAKVKIKVKNKSVHTPLCDHFKKVSFPHLIIVELVNFWVNALMHISFERYFYFHLAIIRKLNVTWY